MGKIEGGQLASYSLGVHLKKRTNIWGKITWTVESAHACYGGYAAVGAAKEHGSPWLLCISADTAGERSDGGLKTPQALTLSDIRSPGNL